MKKKRALAASRIPEDYLAVTTAPGYVVNYTPSGSQNSISLSVGGDDPAEMLRIAPDGFYVRGIKLQQDEKEAALVYHAFREWMTWAALTRTYQ